MTSSPPSQQAMPGGYQDLDEASDHYQTNSNAVSKSKRHLDRVLLFDKSSAFESNPVSLRSPELLPSISEVLGESTPPQSPIRSNITLHQAQTEYPYHNLQQKTISIPKIVIQCEENVINVNPHHQRPVRFRQPRTDSKYSFLLPTLSPHRVSQSSPEVFEFEPHNPKFLSLKGQNRGQTNVSALFDILPQLYPKNTRKRWDDITERGDAGDVRIQERMFEQFLRHAHKQKTIERNMGRQVTNAVGEENYEQYNLQAADKDTGCKRFTSTTPKRLGKGSRNDPRSRTFTWRQQESRDHAINSYNSIAMAFQENSTKDGFSSLSGNLTSDLRRHISQMSNPSSGGKQYPNMHLFDVMKTKRNHDGKLRENSSPTPIAEGIDLSTLLPSSLEGESNPRVRQRVASQGHDLKEEDRLIIDVEDEETKRAAKQIQVSPVQHEGFLKTTKEITYPHRDELCKAGGENDENGETGTLSVYQEYNENEKQPKTHSLQRQKPTESCDIGAGDTSLEDRYIDDKKQMDIEFHDVLEHRIESTKKVGDGYEYTTEIRYNNTPGSADEIDDESGEQKLLSCASWKVPNNNEITLPHMSVLHLHEKTVHSASQRYIPDLSKSTIPAKEIVSVYSQKVLAESSIKMPRQKRMDKLPVTVKHNTWMNEDIKPKVDTGLRKNKSMSQLQQPNDQLQGQQNLKPAPQVSGNDPGIVPWENMGDFKNNSSYELRLTPKSRAVIPPSKLYITEAQKLEIMAKTSVKDEEEKDSEEEEAEYQFMRRIKARVLRMRKVLPPPSPTKLCFFVTNSTRNHRDIMNQIESCRNVKITSLQYDPVYIARCGKGGYKSMWIFEITPDSDRNFLLSYDLEIDNQVVTVRPLDDVYKEEHRTYQMYHAVRVEQKQKMLTTKRRKITI